MKNLTCLFLLLFVSAKQIAFTQDSDVELTFNCSESFIDLSINGGYAPYEVEWQKWEEGQGYVTIADWPKFDLQGTNGEEDIYIYHGEWRLSSHYI